MTISSGTITDEMIQRYIDEQEGEPVDYSQFTIDSAL
ncbi:IS200/IS605 family transposase domain protein [Candidatus Cyrtobacter comes]|uniref:IS200/IS605 family transposase domain protein n=1 Tax=Candidatus Cyrtobacter comes TaxID=675776 RepID=A0ABU5L982_9RICK|nr:IS200/IS605 family transposase domain protein [Candidatus Cyrtobacter comes]